MKDKLKQGIQEHIFYILAFVIPFAVALVAFVCQGIWPFGERGVTIIDSYHQYVPFFSELQYKWRHFDSLLYSWNGGLGMNFWAVIAYYLASPLNLLLLVFPKSMVMECFTFIYFLKLGFSGASFAYFLRKRFGRKDLTITVFGCCYALCSFIIGYGWNIMWLDCMVFFPLVMLGIYQLVHHGKGWTYGVSLAACIFTNYYIAFMICIFSCIFLIIEMSCEHEVWLGIRVRRVLSFVKYSLLAGGAAGVMILPTAYALMSSQSSKTTFPTTLKFYHNVFELMCQQFAFVEPTSLTGNFNLYCGAAMLILVPMFVFNRKIRLVERSTKLCVAVVLLICLNTNYLTYIWHGFHFPNGLPGRYSFIYIFMILIMAYEGYEKRKSCPRWLAPMTAGVWLVFLGMCVWLKDVSMENYTIIVNVLLLAAYGILLVCVSVKGKYQQILEFILLTTILIESCAYGIFGLCMNGTVNRKDYYSDQAMVREIKQCLEENEGDAFYRVELEERRGRDDVTWHNIPGMSLFSSTVNAGVDNIVKRLGFYAVTNKYSYEGATPETDAFLNIKYLISRNQQEMIRKFLYLDTVDLRHLYINEDAIGLGFMVSEDILSWDYEKTNPFEVINQWMTSVMGREIRPYTYFGVPEPLSEGCTLTTDSWADWSYTSTGTGDGTVTYSYVSDMEKELYFYFKAPHCTSISVQHGDELNTYSDEDGHIIYVGCVMPGESVTLKFSLDSAYDSGTIKLIAASHSEEIYRQVIEKMKQSIWNIQEKSSTRLCGDINVQKEGIMFTSIPYEKGWAIKVDGEEVTPEVIANAFIGIRLSIGQHQIEMTYMPQGFIMGLTLTALCAILLFCAFRKEKNTGEAKKCLDNDENDLKSL